MPNRYGENDEPMTQEQRAASRAAGEMAIARCDFCDDDGYRGGSVCDHKDHASAAARGMAMIRHAMGWAHD
jgi:hypothetical protein